MDATEYRKARSSSAVSLLGAGGFLLPTHVGLDLHPIRPGLQKGNRVKLGDLIGFDGRGSGFPLYPQLIQAYGLEEAVFLCRVIWWQHSAEDWIEESVAVIQAETGLKRDRQRRVRQRLEEIGVLEQHYQRLEHRLKFRVRADALEKELCAESGTSPKRVLLHAQSANCALPIAQDALSSNGKDFDKDVLKDKDSGANAPKPFPVEVEVWNQNRGPLAEVKSFSTNRQKHLAVRRRDPFWVANFQAAVLKLVASDFCTGKNDRGWMADFDFLLVRPDSVAKVMEGKYDNRAVNGHSQTKDEYADIDW